MVSHWFTTKGACPIVYHTGNLISGRYDMFNFHHSYDDAPGFCFSQINVGSVLYKILFLHQRILLVLFMPPLQLLFKSYS